jgi:hypothetical protein
VIDVSNNGHVTDILGNIHELTDLLDGEAVGRMLSAGCPASISPSPPEPSLALLTLQRWPAGG